MSSSEDFKQAIRAGNIHEAFVVAMSNAPELSITTKIIASNQKQQGSSNESQGDNCLRTNINLIEGKIENEIGEKLTGDRYSEIQQFHIRQVTQGHQTIQHNLVSLQKMFQLMSAFQQQQNSEHLSWVDIAADIDRESLSPQPKTNQLHGKTPSALSPVTTSRPNRTIISNVPRDNTEIEPQLPSFEEESEEVVEDLLSLADIDDDSPVEKEDPQAEKGDWGEWLEEEPEVKPEVFDLKSLNIKEAQKWQNWNASDSDSSTEP